jgi:hypothetical protein
MTTRQLLFRLACCCGFSSCLAAACGDRDSLTSVGALRGTESAADEPVPSDEGTSSGDEALFGDLMPAGASLQPGRNDCVARSPKGDSATVGQASSLSRTASRGPPCSVQASNARRRECSSRACRVRDRLEARPTASFRLSWAIDTGTSTTRRGIYASGTAGHRTSIPFPARTCHTKKETGNRFPVSRVI